MKSPLGYPRHAFLTYLFIFVAIELIIGGYLHFQKKRKIKHYLSENNALFKDNYEAVITSYRKFSESLFNNIINTPDVLETFSKAYPAGPVIRDSIRTELHNKLNYVFRIIRYKNYKIFHFHLPDGSSFLRFHKPWLYGDNLLEFRYSVKKANEQRVYVEGFEEGRIENSYRYMHPLFFDGLHIGSVETSIAINEIKEEIAKVFNCFSTFLLINDVVEKEGFTSSDSTYQHSDFTNYYLYNKKHSFDISPKWRNSLIDSLNKRISENTSEKILEGKLFTEIASLYGRLVVVAG